MQKRNGSLLPFNVDFESYWRERLKYITQRVLICDHISKPVWWNAFNDVYKICISTPEQHCDKLHDTLAELLVDHVKQICMSLKRQQTLDILSDYNTKWQEYSQGAFVLHNLYHYLNSKYNSTVGVFEPEEDSHVLIGQLAMNTWKDLLLEEVKGKIQNQLLKEIHTDRTGGSVNASIVCGVINSFAQLDDYKSKVRKIKSKMEIYRGVFENLFLKETGEFYQQESSKLRGSNDCSNYMKKVISNLDEENLRSRKFLHEYSFDGVSEMCHQRMIVDHLDFLHEACPDIVAKEQQEDLKMMYKLLCLTPSGIDVLVQEVEKHIKQIATDRVRQLKPSPTLPTDFAKALLNVHNKYTSLIAELFDADEKFVAALSRACKAAVNMKPNDRTPCRAPEFLARFCDSLLRKGNKATALSGGDIDNHLDDAMILFKLLEDKDIFQRFHAQFLSKRLMHSLSQSMEAEEALIRRLKGACGHEYTFKYYKMLTDITLSGDLNSKFNDSITKGKIKLGVNFSINVLQASAWPMSQVTSPFAIPVVFEKPMQQFELFYSKMFNGRKLTWLHLCGNTEVKLSCLDKPYIVTMGTIQMALLLSFNTQNTLNVQDLQASTKLPPTDLMKQLQTLLDAKLIVTNGPVSEESVFAFNLDYSNRRTKFKLAGSVNKEAQRKEETATRAAVEEERKIVIQAAIVRIMKARKVLEHQALVQEVIGQTHKLFTIKVPFIRKCISLLIEKEYIERVPDSPDKYSYIA